jgi:hypothetical protein
MERKTLTFEIQYVARDIRKYILRKQLGTILFTAGYIFGALFALYVVGSRFLIEPVTETFRNFLVGFLFGVPAVSVLINLIGVERSARAKARRNPVILSASEIGVSYTEEYRTATLEWPAYKRGMEQKDRFVFTSPTGGLLVPKRCFTSSEQLAEFREFAKHGLNGKFQST